jgi:hypothetical protein
MANFPGATNFGRYETIEQLDNLVNDIEFINVVPISGQR